MPRGSSVTNYRGATRGVARGTAEGCRGGPGGLRPASRVRGSQPLHGVRGQSPGALPRRAWSLGSRGTWGFQPESSGEREVAARTGPGG